MGSKAFEEIAAGLREALAYARGSRIKARVHRVYRPNIDVERMRRRLGMSQTDFAIAFGVSVATVRNWEQGRRRPHGPAQVLLVVIEKAPGVVLDALGLKKRRRAA
ncbi:MAG TPA: helix-turn-helix domain-containing protein [Polyangia bacterium]|jgi:putative transcriptional regulator|nr:helix-turn-helix domain-containing protein [Polyangia bacterium]